MKKNGFAPLIIILIIAILGIVGFLLYSNHGFLTSKTATNMTKEFTTKGAVPRADFPKLSFNYPLGWTVNENASSESHDEVIVSKGSYLVEIEQGLFNGPGGCKFKDSPYIPASEDYSVDLTMVDYKEMDSNLGKLRYFLNPLNTDKTKNVYTFCEDYGDKYVRKYNFPEIGFVSIETPSTPDSVIFNEALGIVKSIKPLQ